MNPPLRPLSALRPLRLGRAHLHIYFLRGAFRRPALTNPWLALAAAALLTLVSLLVLLPPCDFTKAFHMASEPFNTPCPAACYPADAPVDFYSFDYARQGCGDCP